MYKFPIFKLLKNPPPYAQDNLFAYVLETAWYGLKTNKLKNENLGVLKWNLLRRMTDKGISKGKILSLLDFISAYLPFEKPEESDTFDRESIAFLNDTKEEKMTITEFRMKLVREEGIEQGEDIGRESELYDNVVTVFEKGHSAESIADLLSKPLAKVQQIIARYQASKND